MVVLIVTAVKPGLKGELSRWMIEPQAGVFVGRISARIRDKLWVKVQRDVKDGSAILVYSSRTEQGYSVLCHGDRRRIPVESEGLTLISQRIDRKKH